MKNNMAGSEKRKKNANKKSHKLRNTLLTIFLSIALIGILSVSAVGAYMFFNVNKLIEGDLIFNLNEYIADQSATTFIYAKDADGNWQEWERLHSEINRIEMDINDVSEYLKKAFIALEDKRFYDHEGVDWRRTIGVFIYTFIKPNYEEGGSTITQQLIKNLSADNDTTFVRKYTEITRALNLEKYFSKEKILETYLNTLYLDQGCYGVETASEYYFGKSASELNLAESACLAAITKAPRKFNPILNYQNNRVRMEYCLEEMLIQKRITEEEYEEALNFELVFTSSDNYIPKETEDSDDKNKDKDKDEDEETKKYHSYYVDYIIQQVIQNLQIEKGYTASEAQQKIYHGGLKIYAAVDMEVQAVMEDVYVNRKTLPNSTVQSAMTIVDYSGRLVGIVGQAGEKTGDRVLNIAANSPRQPGSAIKPLSVYAPGINENVITWSDKIQNYGFMVNGSLWPYNYGGDPGSPGSYKTVYEAIPPSYNTVPAQILKTRLDIATSFSYLQDNFHMSHLTVEDKNYSPLAVGGMNVGTTTLDMAAAYATFGNGGIYYEPYSYYEVTDSAGVTTYLTGPSDGERAIAGGTADVMLEMLKGVVTASNGTGRRYYVNGFQDKTFAKSGTTTEDKDRWYIGGTPYYVCAVWYGYLKPKKLPTQSGNPNPSAVLFKEVMDKIHKGLDTSAEFQTSGEAEKVVYCRGSGLKAASTCASKATGWFRSDYIPSTCTNCSKFGDVVTGEDESTGETEENATTSDTLTTSPSTPVTSPPSPTKPPVTEPPEEVSTRPDSGREER